MNHSICLHRSHKAVLKMLMVFTLAFAAPSLYAACTVSASGVVFGSYDVFSLSPLDSAGTVSIDCDPEATFSVRLSTGGGTYSQRQMSGTSDVLDYNLYTNASRSIVWGDGTGGTGTVGGTGLTSNLTVYGRVPAGQNIPAGSYGDNIVVTVEF